MAARATCRAEVVQTDLKIQHAVAARATCRAEVVQTDLKIQHAVAARATCCAEVVQKWDRFNGSKDSTRCGC